MKYSLKENEKEARERIAAFWKNSSLGRPALYIVANNPSYKEEIIDFGKLSRKELDLTPEWHIGRIKSFLNSRIFLAEAMPAATIMVGTDVTNSAVLIGGDYDYIYEEAIITPDENVLKNPIPSFSKEHFLVRELEKCYYAVEKEIKNKAFLNTPMTLDALTTISMILSPLKLCRMLIEDPNRIKKWTKDITEMYLEFYDYFYDILKKLGYGESSSWLQIMAEGKLEHIRCDFSVMISPAMFDEFAIPDLNTICEHMDYTMFNMDSVCMTRFIGSLRRIKRLNGINWNPEPKEASIGKWIETLRYIKDKNFCLQLQCSSVDEAVFATKELGPDGLMLVLPNFSSIEEAETAIKRIEDVSK